MLSECLVVRCHRCDNGVLSNLERIELHVRVPPPAPTGRCILFTMVNRLPWLTNLSMHDSANTQRCSINRLVQGGFRAIASQAGLLRKLHPTTRANSGTQFPVEASRGSCVPLWGVRTGCAFRLRPQAESASRNRRSNWDAVSGRQAKTKLRWNSPWLRLQPAKSGTIPPQLKLTNGSQGGSPMLRNNGRAFALSMRPEEDAPGIRAGAV